MCINTPGSYECQCRDDYVGNGFNCEIRRCDHGTFGKGEFDDCEGQESKIVHAICSCSNSYKLHCRALVDLRFDSKKSDVLNVQILEKNSYHIFWGIKN